MADQKKAPAEQKKTATKASASWWEKFVNWMKLLPGRIIKPFKSMWHELKRVTWPTKRKLIVYSIVVLVFMLLMGIVIGLFDLGASALVKVLGDLKA